MTDFLLIHGSCHGAWCWERVIPALEARGHSARAIDLPGHVHDDTPPQEAALEACRDAILAAATPETVVVGHSWGGYPISAAGKARPEALRGLISLCAYVPISGLSMVEMRKRAARQPLLPAIRRSADGASFTFDPARVPELFYHDGPARAVARALPRLTAQPIAPQATPLTVTERLARLPRAYIRCTEDRAIPPEFQAEMVANWPPEQVHDRPWSHSPFYADPEGLAVLLGEIADSL